MLTHRELVSKIKELKYAQNVPGGMCFGISFMGLQAVLAKDIASFIRKLVLLKKIPDGQLAKTIQDARERQRILHHKARGELQK
jgi:hypothetical protein